MTKLNQIIAVEKGVKSQTTRVVTDLYQSLEKKVLFAGLTRTYTPKDAEDGDQLPSEGTAVQIKSEAVLTQVTTALTRLIDIIATKDAANTVAKADITVDGEVLAAGVPVTTLMFLEKQVENLTTFVGKLPVLDPAQTWTYDAARGVQVSAPEEKGRTKKIPRNHVLYEATKEHPAQVQMFTEDVIVGTWVKVDFSGALTADRVAGIQSRLDKLRTAIKFAREEANDIDVVDVHYGENILNFLFDEGSPQVSG